MAYRSLVAQRKLYSGNLDIEPKEDKMIVVINAYNTKEKSKFNIVLKTKINYRIF